MNARALSRIGEPVLIEDTMAYAELQADNKALRAANAEMLAALKGVLAGFDANVWCRNTDGDADPAWAIKLFPHVRMLALAQAAIEKAEGIE